MKALIVDLQGLRDSLASSLARLVESALDSLPRLITAAAILAAGWLISATAAWLSKWILRRLGVDRGADRMHLGDVLKQAGIGAPLSASLGQLVFFVLMLAFAHAAVDSLGLVVVSGAIDRLVAFLPRLLAAGLILLFGVLLGRVTASLVTSGAATARLPQAQRLGTIAYGTFLVVAGIMALERLGVETRILVYTVTALVAATAVTMGAAFALGARPVVTHILAGHFLRQSLPADGVVEIRGMRGVVERVGPVDTLLHGEGRSWSISNAQLLEEVVTR